jgi:hypothetical protein
LSPKGSLLAGLTDGLKFSDAEARELVEELERSFPNLDVDAVIERLPRAIELLDKVRVAQQRGERLALVDSDSNFIGFVGL